MSSKVTILHALPISLVSCTSECFINPSPNSKSRWCPPKLQSYAAKCVLMGVITSEISKTKLFHEPILHFLTLANHHKVMVTSSKCTIEIIESKLSAAENQVSDAHLSDTVSFLRTKASTLSFLRHTCTKGCLLSPLAVTWQPLEKQKVHTGWSMVYSDAMLPVYCWQLQAMSPFRWVHFHETLNNTPSRILNFEIKQKIPWKQFSHLAS